MITAMGEKTMVWEAGEAARIDIDDDADVERWARRLCTRAQDVRAAVAAVGPVVRDVQGYLFVELVKQHAARNKR